jgi:hypothetical protein
MLLSLYQWQNTQKNTDDLIIQASVKDGSDSWTPFPIGFSWQYEKEHNKQAIQFGRHDIPVLCAINTTTDIRRPYGLNRSYFINKLKKNGIDNVTLYSNVYFSSLASYKFVVSPEGNGIDCHRHYEALLAGCIPIIEYNEKVEEKYKGLPVLYTKDYSEITYEYLETVYNELLHKTHDFSRLFKSYYTQEEQDNINDYSKFWLNTLYYNLTVDTYLRFNYQKPLIWITLINKGYIHFTKNFLKSMDVHACPFKLIIYCLDKESIDELSDCPNAVCFDASCFIRDEMRSRQGLADWLSMDYKKIVFSKLDAIKYTLEICNKYGIWAVGYIDTDIVVFKDPSRDILNYMMNYQNTMIFSQCDEDSRYCSNIHQCPHICSGVIVFRTGGVDRSIFNYSISDIDKYDGDQKFLLNNIIQKQITYLTVSKDIFLNGVYPGINEAGKLILPESASLLHYNYMYNSKKEECMKLQSMWYTAKYSN